MRKHIPGKFCLYCGELAGTIEHFPPRSVTDIGLLLPACQECNSFAGTEWPFDLKRRSDYVKDKLKSRYVRLLRSKDWEEAEVRKLRYSLRVKVEAWIIAKRIAQSRVAWNAISYLACIDHGNDFAQFAVETNGMQRKERNWYNPFVKQTWTSTITKPW